MWELEWVRAASAKSGRRVIWKRAAKGGTGTAGGAEYGICDARNSLTGRAKAAAAGAPKMGWARTGGAGGARLGLARLSASSSKIGRAEPSQLEA
jgi:hypothetical protein